MDTPTTPKTCAKVIENGPLIVTGQIEITHIDGSTEVKETRASFCRCGLSANKPYCDGGHKGSEFRG